MWMSEVVGAGVAGPREVGDAGREMPESLLGLRAGGLLAEPEGGVAGMVVMMCGCV